MIRRAPALLPGVLLLLVVAAAPAAAGGEPQRAESGPWLSTMVVGAIAAGVTLAVLVMLKRHEAKEDDHGDDDGDVRRDGPGAGPARR